MARIRTIKPSFWADEEVVKLSRDARLLLLGLVSFADDDGRFPATQSAICGYVFPFEDIPPQTFRRWLAEITKTGIVYVYQVGSMSLGCFPKWHKHQAINRHKASNLPAPDIACVVRNSSDPTG